MVVVTVPATVHCRDCGTASETDDLLVVCPHWAVHFCIKPPLNRPGR